MPDEDVHDDGEPDLEQLLSSLGLERLSDGSSQSEWTTALASTSDALDSLIELAAGHRIKAESAGFSPKVAEAMAAALYGYMLVAMFK
jgi:hypothetical protein